MVQKIDDVMRPTDERAFVCVTFLIAGRDVHLSGVHHRPMCSEPEACKRIAGSLCKHFLFEMRKPRVLKTLQRRQQEK
jgi:hypothetical protein